VWTQPTVGQANKEVVCPASVLVRRDVIKKGLKERHLAGVETKLEGRKKLQKKRVGSGKQV
jgi:hypothetical protein